LRRCGEEYLSQSRDYLATCHLLANEHRLNSLKSLLDENEGDCCYEQGHYHRALAHYRSSLDGHNKSPQNPKRFIVLIKITFCHLACGRTQIAMKQGAQILIQSSKILTSDYATYRVKLEAALAWESSQFKASQKLLRRFLQNFSPAGIVCHEEIELLLTYLQQAAQLGEGKIEPKLPRPGALSAGLALAARSSIAHAHFALNQGDFQQAYDGFTQVLISPPYTPYYPCRTEALDGLIRCKLIQHQIDGELQELLLRYSQMRGEFDSSRFEAPLAIAKAAVAYQSKDLASCMQILLRAKKAGNAPAPYHFALNCWIANLNASPHRVLTEGNLLPFARLTRQYFAPSLEVLDHSTYLVSKHYRVSLVRQPSLQALMNHLLRQPSFDDTLADIQKSVWHQSLASSGWRHKITNSFIRLRKRFPSTMSPLIIRNRRVRLFHEAIAISFSRKVPEKREEEILRLLRGNPMSSKQLRQHLAISSATIKRLLANIFKKGNIEKIKKGRTIQYLAIAKGNNTRE
jgi:tetratricopeptide (TPR) repeat protein